MSASSALILAGHGSHISPHTAGIVWRCVDQLRARGAADEVTACFWKEPPSFSHVFDTVTAANITVVPVFTAQGYFTQTVIPAEMGLTGATTKRGRRTIRYTRTLGEHPCIDEIVRRRVEDVLRAESLSQDDTAVVIIGHGTRRSPESRKATRRQVEWLREIEIAAEVIDVYLDDSPSIPEAYTLTSAPVIIAVPFFLAPGSHAAQDVPAALGFERGCSEGVVHGRQVYYTPPVGTDESLCELILELAREAGLEPGNTREQSCWNAFPAVGREALIETVQARGCVIFGQLMLTPYEVCPVNQPGEGEILTSPDALRRRIRERPFRPLSTSCDLPGGWRVPVPADNPNVLHAVVETIYPGAVADWAAGQRDVFLHSPLAVTIARQTGIYRDVDRLDAEQVYDTVQRVCGACVRYPAWFYGDLLPEVIPCKEACNVWLSAAIES